MRAREAHLTDCGWFWAWAVVGCAAALGMVSLGLFALAPAVLAGLFLSSRPGAGRSAFGLLSGTGLLLLYIAWVQRSGEYLNPLPWAIAGGAAFTAGIIAQTRRR